MRKNEKMLGKLKKIYHITRRNRFTHWITGLIADMSQLKVIKTSKLQKFTYKIHKLAPKLPKLRIKIQVLAFLDYSIYQQSQAQLNTILDEF